MCYLLLLRCVCCLLRLLLVLLRSSCSSESLPPLPTICSRLVPTVGAEVHEWPEAIRETDACCAHVAERAAEGFHFIHGGDEKWPTSAEAKAAVHAGADVISPLLVRTSLIMAKRASVHQVQAQASAARAKMKLASSGEH